MASNEPIASGVFGDVSGRQRMGGNDLSGIRPVRFGATGKRFEVIAHRGVRTLSDPQQMPPENTLAAFREATRQGVGVELDVMATPDGVVVVHHDDETGQVFSLPGGPRRITRTPFAQLQQARLNQPGHEAMVRRMLGPGSTYTMNPAFADEKIPTLEAALAELPEGHVYIELKTDTADARKNNGLEERVARLIRDKNLYDRVTVISFCRASVAKIKRLDPKITTGLDYIMPRFLRGWGEPLFFAYCKHVLGVQSVHPPYEEVTPALVKTAKRRGLGLTPWVYRQTRAEEAAMFPQLAAAGVDGVITNAVDLALSFRQSQPA
jgi:glycerophosphoryl diester phosphodiesterase